MGAKSPCKIAWVGIKTLVYAYLVTASPLFGKNNSNTVSRFGVCDPHLLWCFPLVPFWPGGCSKLLGACPWPSAQFAFYWVSLTALKHGGKVGLLPLNVSKFAKRVNKGILVFCRISRQNRITTRSRLRTSHVHRVPALVHAGNAHVQEKDMALRQRPKWM